MILRLSRALAGVVLAAATVACGGGGGSGGPADGGGVNASSRIAWDQPAADAAELASFRFVMYIDGVRTELTGASCTPPASSAGFPCTSSLPAMSAGRHTIELACYVVAGTVFESPKSAPLVITFSGSSTTTAGSVAVGGQAVPRSAPAQAVPRDLFTRDGARLRVEVVAPADQASALAVAPDGAVFFADRSGAIRIARAGVIADARDPIVAAPADGVLDIALDPQFASNHLLYVMDAAAGPSPTFTLSRYREAGGRLGERAVLLDDVPAGRARPSASLTFGPDARLYVGFDDGGDPDGARRAGSYNGKVLRLNADGTTPDDMAAASPVYAAGLHAPRSLAWDVPTASLWVADAGPRRAQRIRSRAGGAPDVTAYRLPITTGPGSLASYSGTLIPQLLGSLLVAPMEDAGYVLRIQPGEQGAIAFSERLEVRGAAAVRVVEVGPDGAIYLGTDREILRIVPR